MIKNIQNFSKTTIFSSLILLTFLMITFSSSDPAYAGSVVAAEINLVKSADTSSVNFGQMIVYSYNVENTGSVQLNPPTVTDDSCSPATPVLTGDDVAIFVGDSNANSLLDPGETFLLECSLLVDFFCNDITNTATARATTLDAIPILVTSVDDLNVNCNTDAEFSINKFANGEFTQIGNTIGYTITISNTGSVSLNPPTVNDDLCSPIQIKSIPIPNPVTGSEFLIDGDDNLNELLDSGEIWSYDCELTVDTNICLLGLIENTASASASIALIEELILLPSKSASAVVSCNISPQISLTMFADYNLIVENAGSRTYFYEIENTGNSPLDPPTIIDDVCSPVSGADNDQNSFIDGDVNENNIFDVGEIWLYDCIYSLSSCPSANLVNSATATAQVFGAPTVLTMDSNSFEIDCAVFQQPTNNPLRVLCTHSPILPQPGESVRFTAIPLNHVQNPINADRQHQPINANSIEIWITESEIPTPLDLKATGSGGGLTTTQSFAGPSFSYGCLVEDNDTTEFSWWKTATVGISTDDKFIPIQITRPQSSALDIVFIEDKNSYFDTPLHPEFFTDAEAGIKNYWFEDIYLQNQDRFNFYLAKDMGEATASNIKLPSNWYFDYTFADVGFVFQDIPGMRNFAQFNKGALQTNPENLFVVRHETGHVPFGLSDEYIGGNTHYFEAQTFPNLFKSFQNCESDPLSAGRTCIEKDPGWFTSDPPDDDGNAGNQKNDDLMDDDGPAQLLDLRRINYWFGMCEEGKC